MKRIVGAVLFGLGVLLLIIAVALPVYVTPAVSQLPYDLERSTSVAVSDSAQFLQIKAGAANIESATLRSTVEAIPQAKLTQEKMTGELEGEAVAWNVFQEVRRTDTSELISAYSLELALDRRSGAAAEWDAAWLDDGTEQPANFAGQVYKFPFGTERRDYEVYDRDARRTFPAKFQEATTIQGVEVYRFEQVVPEQPLVVADSSLQVLLARFAPEATGAEVFYRNTRNYWVEPVTGSFIDVQDQPFKELRPVGTGAPTVLLNANFRYDEATVKASADRASDNARSIQLLGRTAPIGLGVVGLIALVIGGWLVLGGYRPPARHRPAAGGPSPDQPDEAATVETVPAAEFTDTRDDIGAANQAPRVSADAGRGSPRGAADRSPGDGADAGKPAPAGPAKSPVAADVRKPPAEPARDGLLNDVVPPATTNWINGSKPGQRSTEDPAKR